MWQQYLEDKTKALETLFSAAEVNVGTIEVRRDFSSTAFSEPVKVRKKDFFAVYSSCTPQVQAAACSLIELKKNTDEEGNVRVWHRFQSRCLSSTVNGRLNMNGPKILELALSAGLIPAFDTISNAKLPALEIKFDTPELGWFLYDEVPPFRKGTKITEEILRILPAEVRMARKVGLTVPDCSGFRFVASNLGNCRFEKAVSSAFVNCQGKHADFSGADLYGSLFVGGTYKHADFRETSLEEAIFLGTDLRETSFDNAEGDPKFRQCRIVGMKGLPGDIGELEEFRLPQMENISMAV